MNMQDHVKLSVPSLAEVKRFASGFTGAEGEGGYHARIDTIETVGGAGSTTIDGQPLNEIWTELQTRLALFNQQANRMVGLLTYPTPRAQEKTSVPWTPNFEDATEFGRPRKARFQTIFRGFPLKHKDLGMGYTQEYIDDSRGFELIASMAQAESAYWSLQMSVALTAIFNDDPSADGFNDGVTPLGLYSGDGEVPPNYRRWTFDGNHTHYLTSAAVDVTALQAMETHLIHHGYGDDSLGGAGGKIFLHANRSDIATIRGLSGFVPAVTASVPQVVDGVVIGVQRTGEMGLSPEGYFGKLIIIENNEIPAGYLLAVSSGGIFNTSNVVGLRQHENASARGLRLIEGRNARYPLIDSVYDTYLGAGVRHRGAAVVTQITGGAYTVPTL